MPLAYACQYRRLHDCLIPPPLFTRKQPPVVKIIDDGVLIPVFCILQADLRGDVAEPILKFAATVAAMAFRSRKFREEAEAIAPM